MTTPSIGARMVAFARSTSTCCSCQALGLRGFGGGTWRGRCGAGSAACSIASCWAAAARGGIVSALQRSAANWAGEVSSGFTPRARSSTARRSSASPSRAWASAEAIARSAEASCARRRRCRPPAVRRGAGHQHGGAGGFQVRGAAAGGLDGAGVEPRERCRPHAGVEIDTHLPICRRAGCDLHGQHRVHRAGGSDDGGDGARSASARRRRGPSLRRRRPAGQPGARIGGRRTGGGPGVATGREERGRRTGSILARMLTRLCPTRTGRLPGGVVDADAVLGAGALGGISVGARWNGGRCQLPGAAGARQTGAGWAGCRARWATSAGR